MDSLTILLAIAGILGAFALKLIFAELHDWLPVLARRIVDHAITTLPVSRQSRYREELYADLNSYQGGLSKLWRAFDFWRTSPELRDRSFADFLTDFYDVDGLLQKFETSVNPRADIVVLRGDHSLFNFNW